MAPRDTYRHGNLRHALIAAGVELAREGGPDAVVLREATRRVGVAPNAAYRHFADRRALLAAVSQAGLAELARTMERESTTSSPPRARLRALARGYLAFALVEPGLFRAAFATTGMADTDTEEATGAEGRTAYRLLTEVLDDLAASGVLPCEHRPDAEYFVWSTVHGMAVLLTTGPLRGLTRSQVEEAERRVMDAVERGLCP
ncbi:TetR/AcrR family transcriptional regulator [Streptomyces sp. BBFR51]|uniref:TetR/AcrR family transcriptional regulator n=1 Tax=Streptomyces sp. BBFR51 TaxID=3372856 RepID=UPI0037DCDC13